MSNEQEQSKPVLDNGIAKDISEFETNKLKKVGAINEKIVLPSKEGKIAFFLEYWIVIKISFIKDLANEKTLHSIVGFDKHKLKGTETVEKNVLPDKASKETTIYNRRDVFLVLFFIFKKSNSVGKKRITK